MISNASSTERTVSAGKSGATWIHWHRRLKVVGQLGLLLLLAGCVAGPKSNKPHKPVPFPPPPEPPRFFYERTVFGTADVQGTSEEDRWRALFTGSSGKTGQPFSKPFDVAVHKGRVFVSDTVTQTVIALDFPEARTFQFGNKGDRGDLGKPLGLAVDQWGNLYVVDSRMKRVVVYDRDGNYRKAFGGQDVLERPSGIDVNDDATRAYVVDVGGVQSDNHRIHVFNPQTGAFLYDIGMRGETPGELNLPRDVTLAPDGLLYVTDGGNFRVQVFTPEGAFVREWGKPGMRFGQFSRPKGIAADRQGNIYVVDAAFGNFQIFRPDGRLLLFVGQRAERDRPGVFMLPAGIDVDRDGRIYMVDQYFHKLEIFRPAGLPADEGSLARRPQSK